MNPLIRNLAVPSIPGNSVVTSLTPSSKTRLGLFPVKKIKNIIKINSKCQMDDFSHQAYHNTFLYMHLKFKLLRNSLKPQTLANYLV